MNRACGHWTVPGGPVRTGISVDAISLARAVGSVPDLVRGHGPTSDDADFLELAIREGLPLATLDARLRAAAEGAGLDVIR
jgi:hypothetical protein